MTWSRIVIKVLYLHFRAHIMYYSSLPFLAQRKTESNSERTEIEYWGIY